MNNKKDCLKRSSDREAPTPIPTAADLAGFSASPIGLYSKGARKIGIPPFYGQLLLRHTS